MSDYTTEEIDTAATDASWEDISEDYCRPATLELRGEEVPFEVLGGKPAEEGGGDEIYVVIKVGTQLFKKWGWYASHDGAYWDGDLREVRAVERMTTYYE